jgi:DNA-binding MarR family transcriptional regulator
MAKRDWREFRRHMRVLERSLAGALDPDARCCGVTSSQCHALLTVEDLGGTGVTGLALELGLDKSTASRIVDSLVETRQVTRETDPENRRRQHIVLTPRGRRTVAGIHRQWNDYYAGLFAGIPSGSHETVIEGVALLAAAVSQRAPCGCRAAGSGRKK